MEQMQRVMFLDMEAVESFKHVTHKNVFAYRKLQGWYGWERDWIQRLCFWFLRRIGSFHEENVKSVKYKTHAINADKFLDVVINQMQCLDFNWHRRPKRLLVGSEDYTNIMGEVVELQPFSFKCEYRVGPKPPDICGLIVEVIPWMRGILVMP